MVLRRYHAKHPPRWDDPRWCRTLITYYRYFVFFTAPRKNGDDLGVVYGIGFTTLICSEKPWKTKYPWKNPSLFVSLHESGLFIVVYPSFTHHKFTFTSGFRFSPGLIFLRISSCSTLPSPAATAGTLLSVFFKSCGWRNSRRTVVHGCPWYRGTVCFRILFMRRYSIQ